MVKLNSNQSLPPTLQEALGIASTYAPSALLDQLTLKYEAVPSHPNDGGRYDHNTKTIYVSPNSSRPGMTFLHELGHALDAYLPGYPKSVPAQGTYQPASSAQAVFHAYVEHNTITAGELLPLLDQFPAVPHFNDHYKAIRESENSKVKADLSPSELFARGYCQYVIEDSGRSGLIKELAASLKRESKLDRWLQWEKNDFKNISQSYKRLLSEPSLGL